MTADEQRLPTWVTWQHRPFPDANLPLLRGRQPALVDSGFVGHADETAAWVRAHTGDRAQSLVDDPAGAVWHGARRIFAFALMIRDGIPVGEIEPYLHARAWLTDAARLLSRTPEALAAELVDTMLRSGAIIPRDGRLHAAAEHTPVATQSLRVPFRRAWPT